MPICISLTDPLSRPVKKFIPQGYKKNFNNFRNEIYNLIKFRNTLRQLHFPLIELLQQIQNLNVQINFLTETRQSYNRNNYLSTFFHKHNSSRLWGTIKKYIPPTPTHESLTSNNKSISFQLHCNTLMKHYSLTSYLPIHTKNRLL